jgi:hypothetical protein
MVLKNFQAKKLTAVEIEMAVRVVEGIPNAMDMDFGDIEPDPTSLDIAPEADGFGTEETGSDNQHLADS